MISSRWFRGPAVLSLMLMATGTAHADPRATAKEHYVQGLEAAKRGAYPLAVGQFLASWEAMPHPATARNIAKAYEDYGDLDRALLWYKRFQEIAPHLAGEVAGDILRVREALDPMPAPEAPEPEAEAPPPPPDKPSMEDVLKGLKRSGG